MQMTWGKERSGLQAHARSSVGASTESRVCRREEERAGRTGPRGSGLGQGQRRSWRRTTCSGQENGLGWTWIPISAPSLPGPVSLETSLPLLRASVFSRMHWG